MTEQSEEPLLQYLEKHTSLAPAIQRPILKPTDCGFIRKFVNSRITQLLTLVTLTSGSMAFIPGCFPDFSYKTPICETNDNCENGNYCSENHCWKCEGEATNDPNNSRCNRPETLDAGNEDTETPDVITEDTTPDVVSEDTTPDVVPEDTTPDVVPEDTTPDVVPEDVVVPCSNDLLFDQIGNDCNSGVGECNTPGLLECVGADVDCVLTEEMREPYPEICDGLDDDCDGTPDNIGTRYIGELFTLDIETPRPDGVSVLFSCGLPDACEPIVDATCDNNPDAELIDTLNIHVVEYDNDPRFATLHFSAVSPGCYDLSLVGINQKITWGPGEESCVAANQLNILRQGDEYTHTVRVQGAGQSVVLQSIAIPFTITERN